MKRGVERHQSCERAHRIDIPPPRRVEYTFSMVAWIGGNVV